MARKARIELVVDASGAVVGIRQAEGGFMRLDKQLDATGRRVDTFSRTLNAVALAAVARQAVVVGKELFRLGSAVEETGSKFRTVFGAATAQVDAFGDTFASMAGLTRREFQDLAGTTGAILQGFGASVEASAEQTQRVLTLAGDLASFNNVAIEDAFAAIRSGITGESEPLKRFGIVVDEATVKLRALRDTGKTNEKQLTQLEKAQARLNIIFARAGVAVGDLERTQDSAANTSRRLEARLRDQADVVAVELLPAFSRLIDVLDRELSAQESTVRDLATAVGDLAGGLVDLVSLYLSLSGEVRRTTAALGEQFPVLADVIALWERLNILNPAFLLNAITKAMELFNGEADRNAKLMSLLLSSHEGTADAIETTTDETDDLTGALKKQKTALDKSRETLRLLRIDLESLEGAGVPALIEIERETRRLENRMLALQAIIDATLAPGKLEPLDVFEPEGMRERLFEEDLVERIKDSLRTIPDATREAMITTEAEIAASLSNVNVLLAAFSDENAAVMSQAAGNLSGAFADAFEASGKHARAFFELSKAFAIAQAFINTYQGASKALAQGGIFGPVLAATVIAAGLAMVAKIASTQPGGNAGGGAPATSTAAPQRAQGGSDTAAGLATNAPRRQFGGPVTGGMPFLVGERGPELFIPRMGGRIVPAAQTSGMVASQAPVEVRVVGETRTRGDDLVFVWRRADERLRNLLGER